MTPYDWLAWIDGTDCRLLLMTLAQAVADDGCAMDDLRAMLDGWRTNAERALTEADWRADVDGYLEVTADARFWVLSHRDDNQQGGGTDA